VQKQSSVNKNPELKAAKMATVFLTAGQGCHVAIAFNFIFKEIKTLLLKQILLSLKKKSNSSLDAVNYF
jgi:hypothetical protein